LYTSADVLLPWPSIKKDGGRQQIFFASKYNFKVIVIQKYIKIIFFYLLKIIFNISTSK
jgi:hypothetical protein